MGIQRVGRHAYAQLGSTRVVCFDVIMLPTYLGPFDPREAVRRYAGTPGNYILTDAFGRAYVGRQGGGVDRISSHVRTRPYAHAYFKVDTENDVCVRTRREERALRRLRNRGVKVFNLIAPAVPRTCRKPKRGRLRRAIPLARLVRISPPVR